MDIYTFNLSILLSLCLALFLSQHNRKPGRAPAATPTPTTKDTKPIPSPQQRQAEASRQRKPTAAFLLAYTLAMTSDWLQGPFLHPLYRDEHRLPPHLIPLLFVAGFVAAAVSGAFTGRWADVYGRRRACLGFCGVYGASCVLTAGVLGSGTGVLAVGRVLGGVGTGLLFVGFESWVVGAFSKFQAAEKADGVGKGPGGKTGEEELGRVFGMMSGLNSVAAIVCGVGSEWYVSDLLYRLISYFIVALVGYPGVVISRAGISHGIL